MLLSDEIKLLLFIRNDQRSVWRTLDVARVANHITYALLLSAEHG